MVFINIGDSDGYGFGSAAEGTIVGIYGEVIDVICATVAGGFKVGCRFESDRACTAVDVKQSRISTTNAVGKSGSCIRVASGDGVGCACAIFSKVGCCATGDAGGFVDVGDSNGYGFGRAAEGTIAGIDGEVIDVIRATVAGGFKVGCRFESDRACTAVDVKQSRISTTNAVGKSGSCIRIGCGDGVGYACAIFSKVGCCATGDGGSLVVNIGNREGRAGVSILQN